MKTIPQSLLIAGSGMFSPYVPDLTPGRLEQVLKQATGPAKIEPGLTPKEFCSLAKMSRQTLHNMEKRGDIQLVRMGRIVRIPASEVKRLLSLDD